MWIELQQLNTCLVSGYSSCPQLRDMFVEWTVPTHFPDLAHWKQKLIGTAKRVWEIINIAQKYGWSFLLPLWFNLKLFQLMVRGKIILIDFFIISHQF